MKVFISGVAGFLGAHLAESFLREGHRVVGIDSLLGGDLRNVPEGCEFEVVDCCDQGEYDGLLAGCDVVFHCAAAAYEGLSVFSPSLVYRNTLMSSVALVTAAARVGVPRFVQLSSMARYGDNSTPYRETMFPHPVDPYGEAKVASERAVVRIAESHGLEWVICVPHNIYGPRQRYVDPFRNVVSIMINRVLQGRGPVVYGDGSQRRSFTYIDDAVAPLAELAVSPDVVGRVINVGPDGEESVTILELARLVLELIGASEPIEFFPGRPYEVHTATCSSALARELLGYAPAWRLEDGLKETLTFIKERGAAPFEYHLPIEIPSDRVPDTWSKRLM
jgi:UDP-glucose 4-epimerase